MTEDKMAINFLTDKKYIIHRTVILDNSSFISEVTAYYNDYNCELKGTVMGEYRFIDTFLTCKAELGGNNLSDGCFYFTQDINIRETLNEYFHGGFRVIKELRL